jgi:predicted TIM-barrel fold metal-dependent hydrolase
MRKSFPEPPLASPVAFHVGSNGEFVPRPPSGRARLAERIFWRTVEERSRRHGLSRRAFVESVLGTAAALWAIQQAACAADETAGAGGGGTGPGSGGYGGIGGEDPGELCDKLGGGELVFDVQTHHVNPMGAWRSSAIGAGYEAFFASLPQGSCGEIDKVACFSVEHYLREIFVKSDTAVAVLSGVPADPGSNPLEAEEMAASREIVNKLAASERCVIHGLVLPDQGQAQLDGMQKLAEELKIRAWKIYTPYGGWRLDDDTIGIPFIEKARALGVKVICAHKGFPLPGFDPIAAHPGDIGVVAKAYPDVRFLVYHAAYDPSTPEGQYNPASTKGIDTLIKTLEDNGIGKTGNVYAELGSTWRAVMTDPTEAAHALGKLLKHVGEDRIVWGTDSIWYGSPQDQIDAFRAFSIPESLQDRHGYPALTDAVKRKILGLNAAAVYGIDPDAVRCAIAEDDIAKRKMAMWPDRFHRPASFRAVGPQTRAELFDLMRLSGGRPG